MIPLTRLTEALNSLLKPELCKDHCPNGLQIEGKEFVKKIAFAVSADLQTIEQAVALGVDALVCHHGLFWQGESAIITGSKKRKIATLLHHQISLYGYHLPLDIHQEVGNNWRAARELGWNDLQPFGKYETMLIGVRGKFPPLPIEAFTAELEAYYGHTAHLAKAGKTVVSSAALISGGAWRSLREAAECGVDCFITGNFDEPVWGLAFEEKIHFLALGHSATERVGPLALVEKIRELLPVETQFIESNNPF